MHATDPVVRPVRNARSPVLGPLAVLAASQLDFELLAQRMQLPDTHQLYMSRLLYDASQAKRPSLAGPLMGAPYAAMLLEILHAWGVQKAIFLGWCGSIDPAFRIGDIVIPTSALIDEGTSLHYQQQRDGLVHPDQSLCTALQADLSSHTVAFKKGRVWTTDAVFRETPDKIAAYRKMGAHVVEMELSALYSVAVFHAMALAGILAVSDELFTLKWQPGFKQQAFLYARSQIAERLSTAMATL